MSRADFEVTTKRRRVALHAACGLALALSLAGGCQTVPAEPTGVTPLDGQWDLAGQASTGTRGALQGVLTIGSRSSVTFAGAYDVLETTGQGGQRRVSGPVAGRMAGGSTTEFDVTLGAVVRRHIAAHRADTLSGSWFEVLPGGGVDASGSFRAVRR